MTSRRRPSDRVAAAVRGLLIAMALAFMLCFLFVPAGGRVRPGVRGRARRYWRCAGRADRAGRDPPDTLVAPVAVPLNLVFGLAAAWAIARFRSRGAAC